MVGNGKVIVVAIVLAVIMAGIFVFLVFMDRKVKKLEQQMKEKAEQKNI